jgi:hypothetical protein
MKIFVRLILTAVMLKFIVSSSFAEVSISGYQEFTSGSADQGTFKGTSGGNHGLDKAGFQNGIYSRVIVTATGQTDSGFDITGSYTLTRDCRQDTDNCGVSSNENSIAFGGAFGTIAFGETGTVGTSMHSRMTAGIPTAEPDGLLFTQFITTDGDNTYTGPNETKYATNPVTLKYFSNSYEGFSLGVSYTSNSVDDASNGSGNDGQVNDYTSGHFNDLTEVVLAYSGEFDGIGIGATYGYTAGNAGTQGTSAYNDLSENTYSITVSYEGFSADYRSGDRGDAGRIKNDGSGGQEYASYCAMYSSGPFAVGYCEEDSDFTTASAGVNNQSTQVVSAGYTLGGGAALEVAFFDFEQTANSVSRTDADGVLAKLSFGF